MIGQYIADIAIGPGDTARDMSNSLRTPGGLGDLRKKGWMHVAGRAGPVAWLFALGIPFIAGGLLESGIVTVLTKETTVRYGRYGRYGSYGSHDVASGPSAVTMGCLFIAGSLALFFVILVAWIRGWDDDTFRTKYSRLFW